MSTPIRIGISSCLLGERVRYDGGHKRDSFLVDTLGGFVEYVAVCPEVECGLGVPRESMRLTGDPEAPRLVATRSGADHTERMLAWARRRVAELAGEDLCGFVFKSRSPSSGMERVKVYSASGAAARTGVGLFAKAFMERFPGLPVEEEGRLNDPQLRENFIERIFTLRRWREQVAGQPSAARLVEFQSCNKLLIMSHSPAAVAALGRIVATCAAAPSEAVAAYERELLAALGLRATVRRNSNVLHHAMGYFKRILDAGEKAELLEVIDRYHRQMVPLVVPLTLLGHYIRKYGVDYLAKQTYFNPHPVELCLRNHA